MANFNDEAGWGRSSLATPPTYRLSLAAKETENYNRTSCYADASIPELAIRRIYPTFN
jgi:hypothetical protein